MITFKEYLNEAPNSQRRYCPKCDHNSLHDKDYDYGFDDPNYDENKPPKVVMKCRGCGNKQEVKIRGKRKLKENWQRAILRKHGSVKPGHWNGNKFVTDLSKQDTAGFDHERCKSINAQVEVNGKVVAGELKKLEETSSWKEKKNIDKSKPWAQQVRPSVEKERKRLERIKNVKGYDAYLNALKKLDEANKYDYEWDHESLTYHVTKNGERIKDAHYKAKSQFDRSAADEAAKKHAQKLKVDEINAEKKQREHDYQYNKPLSEIEKHWVELDKKLVHHAKSNTAMPEDELKKYTNYGQVVRKSLLNHSHPAMSHRSDHKPIKESVELDEMARQSKLQPNSTHGPFGTKELVDLIGKTKANALFRHKWYQRHVGSAESVPGNKAAHRVTVDSSGYPTIHSTTNFTYTHPTKNKLTRQMIQTNMAKEGGKVYQVHLFHNYNNERHDANLGGGPTWDYQRSLHNDDKED